MQERKGKKGLETEYIEVSEKPRQQEASDGFKSEDAMTDKADESLNMSLSPACPSASRVHLLPIYMGIPV